jgi:hypothetical protein
MDLENMANKKKTDKSSKQAKSPKKVIKKITRRRRKITGAPIDPTIVLDLDQVYRAINRVQLARETVTFKVLQSESAVIDNILKDLQLPYKKKDIPLKRDSRKISEYHVDAPPIVEKELDFENMEELPDELLEEGRLFF